jgi:predicted HicB family RNase H-like nuclease
MPETVVHFQIRMPPDLHERLASLAKQRRTSLNLLVVDLLREASDAHHGTGQQKVDGKANGKE